MFPKAQYGYVGKMTVDGPMFCGGRTGSSFYSDCHILTKGGTWIGSPPIQAMKTKRAYAAATMLGGAWWVTGEITFSAR